MDILVPYIIPVVLSVGLIVGILFQKKDYFSFVEMVSLFVLVVSSLITKISSPSLWVVVISAGMLWCVLTYASRAKQQKLWLSFWLLSLVIQQLFLFQPDSAIWAGLCFAITILFLPFSFSSRESLLNFRLLNLLHFVVRIWIIQSFMAHDYKHEFMQNYAVCIVILGVLTASAGYFMRSPSMIANQEKAFSFLYLALFVLLPPTFYVSLALIIFLHYLMNHMAVFYSAATHEVAASNVKIALFSKALFVISFVSAQTMLGGTISWLIVACIVVLIWLSHYNQSQHVSFVEGKNAKHFVVAGLCAILAVGIVWW